jgi:tRNA (cmo5U34)-methyltransferase
MSSHEATPAPSPEAADRVEQDGAWEFDAQVAEVFDDMLERSIPRYREMREVVTQLATSFVKPHTAVVDLGCSRGEALARVREFTPDVPGLRFVGAETSRPMVQAARKRFNGVRGVEILDLDLRSEYPLGVGIERSTGESSTAGFASVTLAILTLQFVPIDYRQHILRRVYETTIPGGALIVVEKVLGEYARLNDVFVGHYYKLKHDNGYEPESIKRKRLALEGVLVPVTARMNEQFVRGAGFSEVDTFWRWMNFGGWIGIK